MLAHWSGSVHLEDMHERLSGLRTLAAAFWHSMYDAQWSGAVGYFRLYIWDEMHLAKRTREIPTPWDVDHQGFEMRSAVPGRSRALMPNPKKS